MRTTGYVNGALPFSGSTPLAAHCSWLGAEDAKARSGKQTAALLGLYEQHGPLTDAEAARRLGVERTTVNARRNELVRRGLVVAVDTVKAATGIRNTRWGLKL